MSKILRLGYAGANIYQDWTNCGQFPYGQNNRATIQDPNGSTAKNEITSIPSPFARIALVKSAFKEVVNSNNLAGNTIFHKMVSDTLDVGEIFFNYDKFSDGIIEIIEWDCNKCVNELLNSISTGHKYLGDALQKYLISDAKTYNFGDMQSIYLLNYKKGPKPLNIIGATSPATVFFSNANDISYVKNEVQFVQDKPFDSQYQPLYKRDFEYVKLWFYLKAQIRYFASLFPEVNDYLDMTYRALSGDMEKKNALDNVTNAQFDQLGVSGSNNVEVLGHPLYKRAQNTTFKSDFEIKPTRQVSSEKLPLILPVEAGNKYEDLHYTTAPWGKENHAPYVCNESKIESRKLPFDNTQYPYLTISDFLENTIIKVDHKLNKDEYFDGNLISKDNKRLSYLLPLKPRFFSFFSISDLINGLPSGQRMIEMEQLAGSSVKVTIRIPIVGHGNITHIEYSRIYYSSECETNVEKNEGHVADFSFDGFIMPRIRFSNENDAIYKVGCISTYSADYDFRFYESDKILNDVTSENRNKEDRDLYKSKTYSIEQKKFNYIQVCDRRGNHSLLIPKFKEQRALEKFIFAIDFGTSNTHVEYTGGTNINQIPKPFCYEHCSGLISNFFVQSYWMSESGEQRVEDLVTEKETEEANYLPESLGNNSNYKFPTRSVLSYSKTTDWGMAMQPFEMANIPFVYNKLKIFPYNKFETDLKWGRDKNTSAMIDAFLECLMLTIRNFVVVNNGKLDDTIIVWFYPISMSTSRINSMNNAWNRIVGKYFNGCSSFKLTESFAPTLYFFNRFATATNLVNVDIGGGTTDMAYAINKKLNFVTSFKFATNDLFENMLLDAPRYPQNNGIVDFFKDDIINSLNKVSESLTTIAKERDGMPAEMASLFFSLKENNEVKGLNVNEIDFALQLSNNEEFKIVFVIFYSAIIYHLAKILQLRKLTMPRHMTFSGNGSKIINVITNGNVEELQSYTKTLFKLMNVEGSDGIIEILGLSGDIEPKQSTCKGGILAVNAGDTKPNVESVVLKGDGSGFISAEDTFATINDVYINKTAAEIRTFFDFVLNKVNQRYNFNKKFGISIGSLGIAREVCFTDDIKTFIKKGKAICEADAGGNPQVEETLFFYPIKGLLSCLSAKIYEKYKPLKANQ